MDALIAEKVFGWTRLTVFESRPGETLNHGFPPDGYHPFGAVPPNYSTDIATAWLVVEKLEKDYGYLLTLSRIWTHHTAPQLWQAELLCGEGYPVGLDATPALAICHAALAAIGDAS